MRPSLFLAACVALAACAPTSDSPAVSSDASASLPAGTWTGGLTPMNHPDLVTPVTFDVSYDGDVPAIALVGPDGSTIPTRSVALTGDSLHFVFDEPEAGVPLQCAFAADGQSGYEGQCTDADGKWAAMTMVPPVE